MSIFLVWITVLEMAAYGLEIDAERVERSGQMVVVLGKGWEEPDAVLALFEKRNGEWIRRTEPVEAVVGKKGLGWGRSPLFRTPEGEPVKREGDGRAPAGIFPLEEVFGDAPADEWQGTMPYLRATGTLECVDDPGSSFYNRLVDTARTERSWKSAETMLREDGLYRWGVTVAHNGGKGTVPGGGSCIFLHIWRGAGQGTAGCTALEEEKLVTLIRLLDPALRPLLVQVPEEDYRMLPPGLFPPAF